jgi:UDP-N-acetylmuramoyl-tripeptide--D-alanyl-D-alanine ligase
MAEVMAEWGDGILVLNADNPHGRAIADRFNRMLTGRIVLFGQSDAANVKATDIQPLGTKGIAFSLCMGKEQRQVRLRTPGKHNVSNALAAAAVAWTLGRPADDVVAGLETFRPSPMRMEVVDLPEGLRVINDAYNANPDSMTAALETFASLANGGQSVAVLGDMLELGKRAVSAHRSVGAAVARLSKAPEECIDHLLVVGEKARLMADEALKRGMPSKRVTVCETHGEATRWLKRHTHPGDWVLLKGSRGMGMERVLDGLAPQSTRGSKKANKPARKAKRSA